MAADGQQGVVEVVQDAGCHGADGGHGFSLGIDDAQIQRVVGTVAASMIERYGVEGMALFENLLGNRKG